MEGASMHVRVSFSVLSLLALVLLVGCGSGSSTSTSASVVPSSPAATSTQGTVSKADAVAFVSSTPIPKVSYAHWLSVERALGGSTNASHRALGFLITSQWVLGEAAARGVSVSEAQVKGRFNQLKHQSFPKAGAFQKFLSKSGQTEADLLARIKVEQLEGAIATKVAGGKSSQAERQATLASFQKSFQKHWKSLTSCLPAYVMEDCKQYRGAPEQGVSSPTGSSTSSGSSSSGSKSSSSASGSAVSNSSGEVYSPPGAFSLASSAFERNGPIPTQYTCAGAGISPPLNWEKVPAHAVELVLFIIDDNSSGSKGGIRWIVGGIDPSSKGVAAGKVPPGGIVGTNAEGKVAYGSICPAHGKADTIEFVMYALSKTIPLSPGFQPSKAESEYGAGKALLGQAAVTYATASR